MLIDRKSITLTLLYLMQQKNKQLGLVPLGLTGACSLVRVIRKCPKAGAMVDSCWKRFYRSCFQCFFCFRMFMLEC